MLTGELRSKALELCDQQTRCASHCCSAIRNASRSSLTYRPTDFLRVPLPHRLALPCATCHARTRHQRSRLHGEITSQISTTSFLSLQTLLLKLDLSCDVSHDSDALRATQACVGTLPPLRTLFLISNGRNKPDRALQDYIEVFRGLFTCLPPSCSGKNRRARAHVGGARLKRSRHRGGNEMRSKRRALYTSFVHLNRLAPTK